MVIAGIDIMAIMVIAEMEYNGDNGDSRDAFSLVGKFNKPLIH